MKKYNIALYPGDGIGLDVTAEALLAMRAAAERFGFELDTREFDWGHRYRLKTGEVAPADFLEQLRGFDAIFLGALGDPANTPDHISLKPLIDMRQGFNQYACLRPAQLLPGIESPLRDLRPGQLDLIVVRENSEGEYMPLGGVSHSGKPEETAHQIALHSRKAITRILRHGFELARKRRKRLVMATKSNALVFAMVLWDKILDEVQREFPDVQAEKVHIDALSMQFVSHPRDLDIVVASNLFGDILSDLAGVISGGIGLAPSANINPEREYPSLFESVHGSAPDIAGKGIANPIGAIRSAAMLLDFLGESDAADAIEKAVRDLLQDGRRLTPDLGGAASTSEMGADIAARISAT